MTKKDLLEELERAREHIAALKRAAAKEGGAGRARSDSETLLWLAAKLASLGHWTWDSATGGYSQFSEELSRIYGVDDPADLLAAVPTHEASFDLIHPDDREGYGALIRTRREGTNLEGEYRIVRSDGEIRHVRDMVAILPDESGAGFRIFGTIQDIAESKEAESALREQEITLKALMDSVGDELFIKDTDRRLQLVNAKTAEVSEKSVEEMIGRTEEELFPHANTELFLKTDRRVPDAGETQAYETKWPVGGKSRWIMVRKSPLRAADGTFPGYRGTGMDNTECKQAEEARRESEERVRLIADNLPVLIVYLDAEERYRFANETWAKWYKQPAADIRGRRIEDMVEAKRYRTLRTDIKTVLSGNAAIFEEVVTYPDGATREIEVNYIPHVAADGHVVGVFVMSTAVTDRNRAEEQLRQAQKMEVVGQLTGGIAHDFNNLLAVILGNADLAKDELREGEPLNAHIDALTRAATRGAELTSQLLAFSRK